MIKPSIYVTAFCGLGLATIVLLCVYDMIPMNPLKIGRRLKLIMPDRQHQRSQTTVPDKRVMAKLEVYFDKQNIRNIQKITKRYFDPKKDVIYFSDFKIFMQKCDHLKFTLRKSKKTCNVVRTPIKHYRTCAVVGNGGILLHSGCGAEIDAHEFVIRCNLPPVHKYRRDVGSRTNLTIVNGKRLKQISDVLQSGDFKRQKSALAELGETPGMILGHSIQDPDNIREIQVIDTAIKENKMSTITAFPSNSFKENKGLYLDLIGRMARGNFASTGLNTFALASTFCDKISMYGFYPMSTYRGKPVPYHYYDKRTHSESHDLIEENELFKRLDDQKVIRHVVGKCKDAPTIQSALEGAWMKLQKLGELVI
ncbi:alpha-2,8-sialyltransferase 8B-like [Branchiostoma floridae]|uniref:Alpha-2,8-sialyltransferase 8B-like n=2 Tax=Branchiostoma floridae TaxID=7739 RepID=A0A9J7LCW8_BRAFL|nr:alpha-2,8-sialyltransferase 8B-like [Branchiostoma floridae]